MFRMGQQAGKKKTERVTVIVRRTREETVKWNQMTAPRFQTRQGRDIRHSRPPFGGRGSREGCERVSKGRKYCVVCAQVFVACSVIL